MSEWIIQEAFQTLTIENNISLFSAMLRIFMAVLLLHHWLRASQQKAFRRSSYLYFGFFIQLFGHDFGSAIYERGKSSFSYALRLCYDQYCKHQPKGDSLQLPKSGEGINHCHCPMVLYSHRPQCRSGTILDQCSSPALCFIGFCLLPAWNVSGKNRL